MTPDFQQSPESGFCPQCGEANVRTAAFCAKCGAPLPWAAPKTEPVTPQVVAPVAAAAAPVPPPPMAAPMPSAPVQAVTPPAPPAGVPVLDGVKRLWEILFPRELLTAYKGATPQELLRLYGLRVVRLVLLVVLIKSYAYGIVTILAMGALVCLVVGLLNPQAFRGIFGAKTSKATVGCTFGIATFLLGAIGSNMEPKTVNPTPNAAPVSGVVPAIAPAANPTAAPMPTSPPIPKSAAQARADVAKVRAAQAQVKAQRDLAEKVAQEKRAEREALAQAEAQAKSRNEREAADAKASRPQGNTMPDTDSASFAASEGVTDEMSDVSSVEEWVPDGGQESYRNPRTLKVLLTVQHMGDSSAPIAVKVGNNDFDKWGQTTVTLNYDLLASVKKASVASQLNYFYSFPSLASGHQKTIPLTAFRNSAGRAFDPDQYRLRRVFVESRTDDGVKTWDAHPS